MRVCLQNCDSWPAISHTRFTSKIDHLEDPSNMDWDSEVCRKLFNLAVKATLMAAVSSIAI